MLKTDLNLTELYQLFFENNHESILVIDNDNGNILHVNKKACDFYQYTYEDFVNLNINDLNILSKEQIRKEMDLASIEKRNYFQFTHRLRTNELKRVEVRSQPITYKGKSLLISVITPQEKVYKQKLMMNELFYESPDASIIIDDKKRVIAINKKFRQIFGYTLDEIKTQPVANLFIDETAVDLYMNLNQVMKGETVNKKSVRKTKGHQLVDVNIIAIPYIVGTEVIGALIVYKDISAQIKLEKEFKDLKEEKNTEIKDNKEQLQLILDSTVEGIYGMDISGNCTFCNRSGLKLLGYKNQEELLGRNIHTMIHHSYRNGSPMSLDECKIFNALLKGNGIHVDDEVFWKKDGTYFDVEYDSYPQYKDGKIIGAVVTFVNNTERKINEEHIRFLSYHDSLTELYNRKYFEDRLMNSDIKANLPISIIYGDVNGLKLVNDVFGHHAGDKLLLQAANKLKKILNQAIIARVGGDEFAALLYNTSANKIKKIIKQIEDEFAKEESLIYKKSISLGYATKSSSNGSIKQLVRDAEDKMYKNKLLNKNKVNKEMVEKTIQLLHQKSEVERLHSLNVGKLCYEIGKAMNKSSTELRKLKDAGYLHDIGKIALDGDLLTKPTSLNEKEKKQMMAHPVNGYRILNLFDHTMDLAEGVLNHHEYWDGSGYPKGIKKHEIPELARIIAVCEAFDTMTNRYHINEEDAMIEIKKLSGLKYDPHIVNIFIKMKRAKTTS